MIIVNLLDLALFAALVLAAAGGFRVGFIARAASWFGIGVGILLATRTVPLVLGFVGSGSPSVRLMIGLAALGATVSVSSGVFTAIGAAMRRSIAATPLSSFDRAVGGVFGAGVLLVLVWLLVPVAADVPGTVAQQVRSSLIVSTVDRTTPDPPDAMRALRNLIDDSRFPEVFADLAPAPQTSPPPEDLDVDPEVVEQALASTAHVRSDGCGRRYEGSSFVVAPGMLATNAHVVAGADAVTVRFPDGERHDATVVVFDPGRDIALLEVTGLDRDALALTDFDLGSAAAVLGYPGGQLEPRVAPAGVEDRRQALGRDIYGRERAERRVLFLAASLRQGDSGSAVIDAQGRVGGVVFAISPDQPGLAYALDRVEIDRALASPHRPGDAGPCM